MYTDDRNAQIVLSLLKQYCIKKIVISPGTTNVPITISVQTDPFFEVYSVVDERSAAYFATGLAFESGEPVVISCTGATASRNYLSALTEAYYRNLPIIALTSQHSPNDPGNFSPQYTNRTISQADVKRISVDLPFVHSKDKEEACILAVNKALTMATTKGGGPVHINLHMTSLHFATSKLPDILRIYFYQTEDLFSEDIVEELSVQLSSKKVAVLIGSHRKFTPKETEAIAKFANTYDTVVYCDHTSNYHGQYKVLTSVASNLKQVNIKPDIVIDIGGITGDYSAPDLFSGADFWRISEDGVYHQRCGNLRKQFDCSENTFFTVLAKENPKVSSHSFYNMIIENIGDVTVPDLPLSNTFISQQIAEKLPNGCSLHLGILNSLRNMDFFQLDETIDCSCNVGGFGIDGAVSTLIGQSMANRGRLYFGQIGDLAFFYDMNALGIRHIGNNVRILLVNNGRGVEFRLNPTLNTPLGEQLDQFVTAGGHFGSAKAWAQSMGFEYLTASSKNDFLLYIDTFCTPDLDAYDKPVLFEVYTTVEDEQEGLRLIREANRPIGSVLQNKAKDMAKKVIPRKMINKINKLKTK